MRNIFKLPINSKLFAVLLCSLPVFMAAQDKSQYSGNYQVGPYRGQADFQYYLSENDTIFDGPFKMQQSNLDALVREEDQSFNFQGTFQNNLPQGAWDFQFGKFKTDSQTEVVNYQYRVSVSGIQHKASGSFDKGKPDGLWNLKVDEIEKSEITSTLFNSSIEYDQGIPQRSFRIANSNYTLVGRCLRNGLAHDEWSLFPNDIEASSESWFFDSGVLQKIEVQRNNRTSTTNFYDSGIENQKTINLDSRYLNVLRLKQKVSDSAARLKSGLYQLILENASYYQKIDQILSELGESEFVPAFKVKVGYYPLEDQEKHQLDSIVRLYESSKNISESLLDNTQLSILKLSDEQALFMYAAVREISQKFLQPLEKLTRYKKEGILELVTRQTLLNHLMPDGRPSAELTVVIDSESGATRTFNGPDAEQYDFSGDEIRALVQMALYADYSLDSIQAVLSDKLTLDQREQDVIALEEELIEKSKAIYAQIDSNLGSASGQARKSLEKIRVVVGDDLSRYATLEDLSEKVDSAQALLRCFGHMERLTRSVGALPAQSEEIKDLYSDDIWNPFMAVIMTEEVKKRIVSSYRRVVLPHLLKRISADLSCKTAEDLAGIMEQLYQRMREMRDEDTSKLERRLKRQQDPQEILDLFEVEQMDKE